jgi:putative ABC transport system substrate-binding protein
MGSDMARTVDLIARSHVPAIYQNRAYVDRGGLMSYGVNGEAIWRRAAGYVDKILRGTRPGDLPVEQTSTFELVINRKTAANLGLLIPPEVATQVTDWMH